MTVTQTILMSWVFKEGDKLVVTRKLNRDWWVSVGLFHCPVCDKVLFTERLCHQSSGQERDFPQELCV